MVNAVHLQNLLCNLGMMLVRGAGVGCSADAAAASGLSAEYVCGSEGLLVAAAVVAPLVQLTCL
jgi:hypothetical protein